ncbi:MAG: Gfo/Idh/MocA family oxidoreductase [Bacteroidales bacterium]|nr:Gfo/Idh/MocA family oxidoreductase [Bacteroidales bacterium]
MNVGILGAGHISAKVVRTLNRTEGINVYAVASRSLEKALDFAKELSIGKAYGSYEELVMDPEVDLVYVATPNSHHFAHASMAVRAGKAVLCEKAFTANAREARELVALARERKVYLAEAIWTRYMPMREKLMEVIGSGIIGRPRTLTSSLCYPMESKERVLRPELGGGTLLDLGVYNLNLARMVFGTEIAKKDSIVIKGDTGVDMYESIVLQWKDGQVANLISGAFSRCNREALITGEDGYIVIENMNSMDAFRVFKNYTQIAEYKAEGRISGYEYEFLAAAEAIEKGLTESPYMPLDETVAIMEMMDSFRKEWGVVFPAD